MDEREQLEALQERICQLEGELLDCRSLERALSESEQRWKKLVENSLTGIYVDQGGRIIFANERFARIYGYSREELIGIESHRLVHPEDRAFTDEMRAKRLRGEKPLSEYDARGITKEGKTIWVRRMNTDIEYRGTPSILGNLIDITEEKRFEEELEEANAELREFMDVVSHDLKTPLIAIRGFVLRLLRNHAGEANNQVTEYLRRIESSAERMDSLISDLRAFLTSGHVRYHYQQVASREIIEGVVNDLEAALKARKIALSLADNLPSIYCDPEKMQHVFQNLIENAVKYLGDTPNPRIEIGYEDRGDMHQFSVFDNGMGIDPRNHKRIFKKFQRLKEARDEQGSGLGLAIVERIVQRHGGKVWVESERGKGATFVFVLPKCRETAQKCQGGD